MLQDVTKTNEQLRGGMTHHSYRAQYETKTVLLNVYVMPDGRYEQFQRLLSRVARFHPGQYRNIDLPDRRWKVTRVPFRFVPLLPPEKARLVLPHIKRMGQYRLVLDPDDLLVNKNAAVPHRFLDFNLALRCMPDVDRGVVLTNG